MSSKTSFIVQLLAMLVATCVSAEESDHAAIAAARSQVLAAPAAAPEDGSRDVALLTQGGFQMARNISSDVAPSPFGQLPRPRFPQPGDGSGGAGFTMMGVSMFAASASDLISTELGIARGAREANPFQTNRSVRIASHVAAPALAWWLSERADAAGNEKLAWFLRVGFTIAYSYATVHNLRTSSALP